MKILVLTSSTGGGHDMRARALREWAARAADAEAVVHQALEDAHGLYRFGVGFYNFIQKNCPALHHVYFNFLEVAGMCRSSRRMLGKKKFQRVLKETRPDVIVSVHGTLNHGFFELARAVLKDVKCVTYCGELFGGYGFSKHWVNPQADLFIGAVDETCQAAADWGMPLERIWSGGFLLRPAFWAGSWREQERDQFVEKELGFDPRQFLLVLGTGAMGANCHLRFLNALWKAGVRSQVLALCGRSKRTLAEVKGWARLHSGFPVKAMAYTDDMPRILGAASAIVARPGTGTTSEAILSGCPLIFNGLGGVMPQEGITVKFCRKYGLGQMARRARDLPVIVAEWMRHPERLEEIRRRMAEIRPKNHPLNIFEKLAELT
ncbi:MAG: glycosyltransferase [bacterium]